MSISSTQRKETWWRKDTLTVWRHREERLFYAFNKETASIWVSAVVTQINHLKSQRHLTRCVVGFICEEQRHPRKKACHLSSFISLWLMLVLNYLSTVCLHSTGGDLKDGKRDDWGTLNKKRFQQRWKEVVTLQIQWGSKVRRTEKSEISHEALGYSKPIFSLHHFQRTSALFMRKKKCIFSKKSLQMMRKNLETFSDLTPTSDISCLCRAPCNAFWTWPQRIRAESIKLVYQVRHGNRESCQFSK